jgi:hypothetical protein
VSRGSCGGLTVALKELDPVNKETRAMLHNEIELNRKLQSRTLQRMYGVCELLVPCIGSSVRITTDTRKKRLVGHMQAPGYSAAYSRSVQNHG